MIEVVSAIIIRDFPDGAKRVLLTQRDPARSDYGMLFETPGGKVELGELQRRALYRETKEELGIEVLVCDAVARYIMTDLPKPVNMTFYFATITSGEPKPLQAIGLGWFAAAEVQHLAMVPGNVLFRDRLVALLA